MLRLISLCTAVLPVNFSQGGSIKECLILKSLCRIKYANQKTISMQVKVSLETDDV